MRASKEKRECSLEVKFTCEEFSMIEYGAHASGLDVSSFLRIAGIEHARQAIESQWTLILSDRDFDLMISHEEDEPTEDLVKLMLPTK